MLRRALVALAVALALTTISATGALAAGSDGPTPYRVTSTGVVLPAGRVLGDNEHVNVHYTLDGVPGSANVSTEIPGKPDHDLAALGSLPWSRLGVPVGASVTWVQVGGYDEHFGEGHQAPVCVTTGPAPTPPTRARTRPTPPATPASTPASTATVAPRPSGHPTTASTAPTHRPSRTQPTPAPAPSVTAFVLAAEDGTPPDDTTPGAAPEHAAAADTAGAGAVLAATGSSPAGPALLGLVLVVVGAAATVAARARRRPAPGDR